MSNDSLLALCWLVLTTGQEIEVTLTRDGTVKWYKLGKYRVCQTQNSETGEFRYTVIAKRKLLGITYC
jgi:hypothetical protein